MAKISTIYDDYIKEYRELGGDMVWTMKDGTDIPIKDMKCSHIRNCINMLNRKKNGQDTHDIIRVWVFIFRDTLNNRRTDKLMRLMENIRKL